MVSKAARVFIFRETLLIIPEIETTKNGIQTIAKLIAKNQNIKGLKETTLPWVKGSTINFFSLNIPMRVKIIPRIIIKKKERFWEFENLTDKESGIILK